MRSPQADDPDYLAANCVGQTVRASIYGPIGAKPRLGETPVLDNRCRIKINRLRQRNPVLADIFRILGRIELDSHILLYPQ